MGDKDHFEKMKLFYFFVATTMAISNLDVVRENKSQANAILSRKRRGIKKTIGKVAAVGGALYIGKKLAGGIEVNAEVFSEDDDGPGLFGPRVYSQEPIMDEEKIQEMEEIREEPEEEREGPFNLFGWFRG